MQKNISKLLLVIVFLISQFQILNSQTQEDLQLWTEISVSKKIEKIEFTVAEEFRFHQNISAIQQFFTDFGVTFKINKYFDLGTNYRFAFNHIYIAQYQNSHRFNVDAKINFEIKRLKFYYKVRYQTEVDDFLYIPTNDYFSNKIRNKINFKYDIKKTNLTPFATIETFTNVDNTNYFNISKLRLTLGFGFTKKILKGFSMYFRVQNNFSKNYRQNDYILGVSYAIDL